MQAKFLLFTEIFVECQCFKGLEFKCSVVTRRAQEQKPSNFQTQNASTIPYSPINLSMIRLSSICQMLTICQAVSNEQGTYYSFPRDDLGLVSIGYESPAVSMHTGLHQVFFNDYIVFHELHAAYFKQYPLYEYLNYFQFFNSITNTEMNIIIHTSIPSSANPRQMKILAWYFQVKGYIHFIQQYILANYLHKYCTN